MKKLFLLFVAFIATTTLWAGWYDFDVDGIYYNYLDDNNVEVTYRGNDSYSYDNEYAGEVTIPSTVTYNGTTYSVTSIGNYAFSGCSSLTSVTIPNSVTSIGDWAFASCSSLTSITIPNSVTSIGVLAFDYCSSLSSMVVEEGNTTYDSRDNCNAIIETATNTLIVGCGHTTIPNSVTSIGDWAFASCSSLKSITIPNSVTSIGSYAFNGCSSLTSVTISNSVTSIGNYAFRYCYSLTSVTIPESVTSIGDEAFASCSSLKSITIPNSVTSIGSYAFSYCSSLSSVTIPSSVPSIGNSAFDNCSSLTSVTINSDAIVNNKTYSHSSNISDIFGSQVTEYIIGESVTSIGDYAFYDCSSLTSVTIPESVTSIGVQAFYRCSLTSVTIPNSVTNIEISAFQNCSSLTKTNYTGEVAGWCNIKFGNAFANPMYYSHNFYVNDVEIKDLVIPNKVESIHNYAFFYCSSLKSVTTPNSLKTIGTYAFGGCDRLGEMKLGTGLEEIAANAFAGCTRLYDIYVYATYPPFAEETSFANYNVYLYIPCEYQRDYTLDVVWGKFKFIECIESEDVTTDGNVTIVPGYNDVTITWPTEDNAYQYVIVIKKDGEVVCTLTFNAEGQLLNIAFAPGRDGNRPAQYAEQVANGGFRFTVTGLEEDTSYDYTITTKDASGNSLTTHSGEFTTQSNASTTVDNVSSAEVNCQKFLRDGQLLILRDRKTYNVMGQEL